MTNNLLRIKIQQRLNKLGSFDYDNIECWQISEAFNKAQIEWFRRQVRGLNTLKESTEESYALIDDLQRFVKTRKIQGTNKDKFFETTVVPKDYLYYVRISAAGDSDCCKDRDLTVYLAEEGNADIIYYNEFKGPSFEWGETFATMQGDKFRIYRTDDFKIQDVTLTYYRKPVDISFDNCVDPATGDLRGDVETEFKDDIAELILDEAVAILAGDIESMLQYQRATQNAQKSN
jgi:hypothetical protein